MLSNSFVTLLDELTTPRLSELQEKHINTEVKIVYPLWPPPGHFSIFPHV
ncbi:hypothetical protein BDR05DRAFT_1006993 [Suillus weaverae]|nr:hypothetical protein BDR05DRAFT_1006993 [Suillus weaverae]